MKTTFLLILLISAIPAIADGHTAKTEIYKTVDNDGNIIFTDRAEQGAKNIQLKQSNTVPAVKPRPSTKSNEDKSDKVYQSLAINSPTNESIIANGLIPFNVSARISPNLKEGHELQLLIDGKLYESSNKLTFTVKSIQRGKHSLQIRAVNEEGLILIKSKTVSVFAYRPSSNN